MNFIKGITKIRSRKMFAIILAITFLSSLAPGPLVRIAEASVTATHLTSSGNDTDASSYTTASITPSANKLILVAVENTKDTTPDIPTLSGNGLTWVQVNTTNGQVVRITLFRSMGASPSAGTITIDFAGVTQTGAMWSIAEFDGVDTTGTNGSGAIVQSVTGGVNPDTYGWSITLGAFGNANNAAYGAFTSTNATMTAGTGFTLLGNASNAAPQSKLATEWQATQNTTVAIGYSNPPNTGVVRGIAVEIKQAAVAAAAAARNRFTLAALRKYKILRGLVRIKLH